MKTFVIVLGRLCSMASAFFKKVSGSINKLFESDMYPEGFSKNENNYDDFTADVIMRGLHNAGLH